MEFVLEKEDMIISTFLKSIGPWKKHVIIGGGFAPIIYKLYLSGNTTGIYPVSTCDLDSLIAHNISNKEDKKLLQYLLNSGFKPIFKDLDNPATESYIKEIEGIELEVEFLTSSCIRRKDNKNIKIAGVVAQPLKYLELSIQKAIEFKTHSNNMGLVVKPDTWIFHKGLTFNKRLKDSKKHKDLYGIWYVATQLGEFSDRAIIEIKNLSKDYSRWFKKFQNNLIEFIENASPLDWSKLESQDPYGKFRKINFIYLLNKWF